MNYLWKLFFGCQLCNRLLFLVDSALFATLVGAPIERLGCDRPWVQTPGFKQRLRRHAGMKHQNRNCRFEPRGPFSSLLMRVNVRLLTQPPSRTESKQTLFHVHGTFVQYPVKWAPRNKTTRFMSENQLLDTASPWQELVATCCYFARYENERAKRGSHNVVTPLCKAASPFVW